jgi:hypothetical protein
MSQQRARVSILVHNSGKKAQVQLPINVSVGRLLPHLVRDLQLPTEGEGGASMHYTIALENETGRTELHEEDILSEAGVGDSSVLRIIPSMKAGIFKEKI